MYFRKWLENNVELPYATANEQGIHFETEQPVTFQYLRGKKAAPYFGSKFMQDIEPAGRYIIHNEDPGDRAEEHWEIGTISFNSPLVIKFNVSDDVSYNDTNWKYFLSQKYGKKGKQLSLAIRKDGYDGIVTVGQGGYTKEIVDLTVF